MTGRLDAAAVRGGLATRWLGGGWHWRARATSTNDWARALADRDAPHGTVVVADRQTRGRGRRGHPWHSPAGGLWMSLVLRPRTPPSALGPLGLAVAVAVAEAIEGLGVGGVALKWPNDVLVSGRKVAGILTEAAAEAGCVRHVIVGIGVNLNVARFPADLRDRATSLHRASGASVDRTAFAVALCRRLERWIDRFEAEGAEPVVGAWLDRGRLGPVTIAAGTSTITGVAEGLDPEGALRVRRADGGLEVVRSGEIVG